MPQVYTGNTTGLSGRPLVAISEPVGTDVRNSQSVRTPLEKLTDLLAYVMGKAGLIDQTNTWTQKQTMTGGLDVSGAVTIYGLSNPIASDQAASKGYVDSKFPAPAWTAPTLGAGWSDGSLGANVGYWKDSAGVVYLKGQPQAGSSPAAYLFTLPAGFRPAGTRSFSVYASGETAPRGISITAAGMVNVSTTPTVGAVYGLDSIRFVAEQ